VVEQVEHDAQIQPALGGVDVGDVAVRRSTSHASTGRVDVAVDTSKWIYLLSYSEEKQLLVA
jgi:hypothetical protein